MKKRILPALLALCMVMSLLPVSVFAQNVDKPVENQEVTYKCDCSDASHNGKDCSGTVTLQGQTVTVNVASDASEDVINQAVAAKKTELAATKKTGELCAECKKGHDAGTTTTTTKEECPNKDPKCVTIEATGGHSRGCLYYCACALNAAKDEVVAAEVVETKPAACTHHEGADCKELVAKDGDLCTACKAAKAVADKAAADAAAAEALKTRDCSDTNDGGSKNCTKDKHTANCAASCAKDTTNGLTGCTLTAGHTEKHNSTTCSKDTLCGATEDHDPTCPNWTAPADEEKTGDDGQKYTQRTGRTSKDFTIEVTCDCDGPHTVEDPAHPEVVKDLHKDVVVSGSHTEKTKITVTVYKEYTYKVATDKDGKEDATATETNRKTEEDKALKKLTDSDAEAAKPDKSYCPYCEAALAAEKVVAESDAYDKCDMSATCQEGAEGAKHKPDCLSQCTMKEDCGNTAGNANAHRVLYRVITSTVTAKRMDVEGDKLLSYEVNKSAAAVADENSPIDFDSYAEAKAYALDKPAFTLDEGDGVTTGKVYFYTVRAIHCEKSGAVDSTVLTVAADGTTTETPDKPTKAEDFTDVVDWMVEGVQFMLDKGWMEGMGDGTFGATKTLKTTQVLTVLARMNGETITGSTWEEDAKAWAEKNAELFEGIDLTAPSMARKDVVLALWCQAGKPEPSADFELEFTDADGLEGNHLTAMKWAVESKIVVGNGDGTVSPDADITPATLSLMAMRAFNNK